MTNSHPLDPLSADEIRQAAAVLRRDRKIGDTWRFASIELKEPPKDALPQFETGGQPGAREAIVVCWNRADGQARRATVSLTGDDVTSWEDLPGATGILVTSHAGDFPVQSEHDSGLASWTRADRPIENTDVVLWYVFGIHHITRPEDWPVMPSDIVSFWLKPFGFFDRNPALDVPPSHHPGP